MIWSKSKLDVEFQYVGRLDEFHGMSSLSHLPHCRVLPPGEFNVMIPELYVTLQVLHPGEFNGMSYQSHVLHCRVLPLGELTVMIPEPHAILQGAVTWRNQCHDRATLQLVIIPSAILKIVYRHILFGFCNAVWVWRSVAFVSSPIHLFRIKTQKHVFYFVQINMDGWIWKHTERLSLTTRLSIPNFSSSRTYTSRPVIINYYIEKLHTVYLKLYKPKL